MLASASITLTNLADGLTTFYQYAKNTSDTTPPDTGWSTAMPSRASGEFIWRREGSALSLEEVTAWGNTVCLTGATGPKGDAGEQGPQGPPGNPGELGIYADGTTLHVKGFAEDGTLTAPYAYLYAEGARHEVSAYSETLTNDGQGYVLFDGSTIHFAKLTANGESKKWVSYNTLEEYSTSMWVIGSFMKNGELIYDIETIPPQRMDQFEIRHFMEILNSGDIQDINVWAQANGIGTVFERIAMLEAFVNKLFANQIEIMSGGSILSRYTPEGNPPSDGGGFFLGSDGIFKAKSAVLDSAIISGTGTFKGVIDSPPLKTTTASNAGDPKTFTSKTHYIGTSLDTYLQGLGVPTNTEHTLSGTINGSAFSKVVRSTGGAYINLATISGSDSNYSWEHSSHDYYDVLLGHQRSFTIEVDGLYSIQLKAPDCDRDKGYYGFNSPVIVYKNGTPLFTNMNVHSSRLNTIYIEVYDLVLLTTTETASTTVSLSKGDVISYFCPMHAECEDQAYPGTIRKAYWAGTSYVYIKRQFPTSGVFLRHTNTYTRIIPTYFYNIGSISFSSGTFLPAILYAKATGFVSGVSSYAINEMKAATGSLIYDNRTYTIIGVSKNSASSMTVFHTEGSILFSLPNGDPGTSGYYNASGSFSVISSVAGAEVMNINAKEADTYSIGNTKRFLQIAAKNMTATSFNASSLRILKKDISKYKESALDVLNQVEVVNYRYKSDDDEYLHTGLIADDSPECLTGKNHDVMSLSDTTGMLIKAVQELDEKIHKLEGR
ncbi:tail fiber domain-containing protein [Sphaerochaeta sp. S2]|uniref:tail fiber domain-containing protein n=1 Tax=Sphaerochaeta sp. S2 TaxID=2798868 RepID=UPI0018E99B6B|nr:tail fiber domain-containing protein [Sphaerochaeta sp. S2]MBJ2356710.1 tail fiber domain-containing protein [Sphaerochaeta sp. S2]